MKSYPTAYIELICIDRCMIWIELICNQGKNPKGQIQVCGKHYRGSGQSDINIRGLYLTASGWTRIYWTQYTIQKGKLSREVNTIKYCPKIKSNHKMTFSPMHLMLNKKGLSNCHSIIGCINAVDFHNYAQNLEWCIHF